MSSGECPDVLRECAARLVLEVCWDLERSMGAIAWIAGELGVHSEALCAWVKRSEIDGGLWAGATSAGAWRIWELEEGNRKLRRANEILREASAYFAQAEPGRR